MKVYHKIIYNNNKIKSIIHAADIWFKLFNIIIRNQGVCIENERQASIIPRNSPKG